MADAALGNSEVAEAPGAASVSGACGSNANDSGAANFSTVRLPVFVQVVRYAAVIFFGVTALLKLYALCAGYAHAGMAYFGAARAVPNWALFAVACVELTLAFLLWRGRHLRTVFLLAALCFLGFTLFGTLAILLEWGDCGCLGTLYKPPAWFGPIVGVVGAVACFYARTIFKTVDRPTNAFQVLGKHCVFTIVMLALITSAAQYYFGSASAALDYMNGERFIVTPSEVRVPPLLPGGQYQFEILVHNLTNDPVTLYSTRTTSTCMRSSISQAVIAPGKTLSIPITVSPSKNSTTQSVELYFLPYGGRSVRVKF